MAAVLHKLAGIEHAEGSPTKVTDWLRAWLPLFAPLAIIISGSAVGALAPVALVWIVLLVPGVLAVNLWFPRSHPLGRGASRLGVASVLAMLPFSAVAYLGCLFHWHLTMVLVLYAVAYIAVVGLLVRALLRREPGAALEPAPEPFDLPWAAPRWAAVVVLVAIAVVMIGVCMSAPRTHISDGEFMKSNIYGRPTWWHGAAMGAVASLVGAGVLAFTLLRAKHSDAPDETAPAAHAKDKGKSSGRAKRERATQAQMMDWGPVLAALLWVACAGFAIFFMRAVYSESYPKPEDIGKTALVWNVDDVAYVSEAVDYRYGHPLASFDPSVGGKFSLPRSRMSPLVAPLVASISRITGVECAALHHSVMPPLVVLVGTSCIAAAMMVVFRSHRWAAPLATLVAMMLIFKSWDYARCMVEMLIYRAMQPKALHLWWLHPLQFASIVLLARQASARHLAFAAAIAFVGHQVHPLATIMGMLICTPIVLVALVERRGAFLKMLVVLVIYCALGGEYYAATKAKSGLPGLSSGRKKGEPLQSRDLVRADQLVFSLGPEFSSDLEGGSATVTLAKAFRDHDIGVPVDYPINHDEEDGYYYFGKSRDSSYRMYVNADRIDVFRAGADPIPVHDPIWTFGCNTLYLVSSLAVPLVLALGVRRRELLYIGLIGATVLISTNFEPIGRLLNIALPMSIFWRARWMMPMLINGGALAVIIWWAVGVLLRSRDNQVCVVRSFIACLVAIAGVGAMLAGTDSRPVKIGAAPKELSKFPPEMHELVEKLGGVEASPFVWSTFLVHHELPQLMPNVNLVFSRTKFMRPSDDPDARKIAEGVFDDYSRKRVVPRAYDRLFELYPVDHVVVDRGYGTSAKLLEAYLAERGWRRIGITSDSRYEVWRNDERVALNASTPAN